MTEISLNVTLNNQIHLTSWNNGINILVDQEFAYTLYVQKAIIYIANCIDISENSAFLSKMVFVKASSVRTSGTDEYILYCKT